MYECPRFDFCSVNYCPLDIEKDIHKSSKYDKQTKCLLKKNIRVRIGANLPNRGFRGSEIGGMKLHHPEIFK